MALLTGPDKTFYQNFSSGNRKKMNAGLLEFKYQNII